MIRRRTGADSAAETGGFERRDGAFRDGEGSLRSVCQRCEESERSWRLASVTAITARRLGGKGRQDSQKLNRNMWIYSPDSPRLDSLRVY